MTCFTLVILHLLGAVVWIGGMLFLALVIIPILRGRPPTERALLLQAVGRRFLRVGWAALGILLVTGPVLWALRSFEVTTALVAKLSLVAIILLFSVLHDFFLGPRLSARLQRGDQGEEALRLRRWITLLARLNLLCALAVLILGLAISRGL